MRRRQLLVAVFGCVCLPLVGAARKTNKDWGKMNDKDWDRIFDEWEDEDEKEEYAFKPPKPKAPLDMEKLQKLKGNPKAPTTCTATAPPPRSLCFHPLSLSLAAPSQKMQEAIAESQQTSGPTMMFATVDYPGCCEKKKTEELANKWSSLLYSTGMDAQACAAPPPRPSRRRAHA